MSGPAPRLLISALPGETRYALVERTGPPDTCLLDYCLLRDDQPASADDLYWGRVTRLDRGLEAAFVSLGSAEAGFLPFDQLAGEDRPREGETLALRVTRAGGAGKAAKLSARLDPAQQARVAASDGRPTGPGLIARGSDPLAAFLAAGPEEVRVEGLEAYQALARRLSKNPAPAAPALTLHSGPGTLFAAAEIDAEIEALLDPQVALPGGGVLTIEPVTAMTAVDVDSGRATAGNAQRLARRVNREALTALLRQVRLRALSGLIVIDFLALEQAAQRRAFDAELRRAFAADPQRLTFESMSRSGLVALHRQRARPPLHEILTEPSGAPGGGRRLRPASLAFEALHALQAAGPRPPVALAGPPAALAALAQGPAAAARKALEARLGVTLELRPEPGAEAVIPLPA